MSILEDSKKLYAERGREFIHSRFPEYEGRIAAGLAGHGSECYGFDDAVSRDHDCAAGFCLWVSDGDDVAVGVELARAYRSIAPTAVAKSAGAGQIRGVLRIGDFYRRYVGAPATPENWQHWLSLPSYALAEATNGEVWRDDAGEFSAIREKLLHGMPEDVRKKKLAARVMTMAQSGQYNYSRCLAHGEHGAAMLALGEFVLAACETAYLLNRAHMPYYKWALRGMGRLTKLADMAHALTFLLTAENDAAGQRLKVEVVEDICANVASQLRAQGLSCKPDTYLEPHAYELMESIENKDIRALHVME